jgi:hypothetical protein
VSIPVRGRRLVLGAGLAAGVLAVAVLPVYAAPGGPVAVTKVSCSTSDLIGKIRSAAASSSAAPAVLSLAWGCKYVLDAVQTDTTSPEDDTKYGNSGTPMILGRLGIRGNGATITRSRAGGTPSFRIFTVGPGGQLALDGLTISNGRATCDAPPAGSSWCSTASPVDQEAFGGGIGVVNGSLVVTDAKFTGNTATCDGAVDCTATSGSSTAGAAGGAIGAQPRIGDSPPQAYVTITGSTFTGNSVRCASSTACVTASGGAVGGSGSDLHVSGSHFTDNSVSCTDSACLTGLGALGGALYAAGAPDAVSVATSDFGASGHPNTAGSASDQLAFGGAITLLDSTADLSDNQIRYNQANATHQAGGGGVFLDSVTPTTGISVTGITGGSVDHNTATAPTTGNAGGGGIYASSDNAATGDQLHLADLAVAANVLTAGMNGQGGGLGSFQPVQAVDTHFDGNTVNGTASVGGSGGGGLFVIAPLSLEGGSVSGNRVIATVAGSSGAGGGITVAGAGVPVSLVGVRITDNSIKATTTALGGGIFAGGVGPMIVQNTQVQNNSVTATDPTVGTAQGGGVYTGGGASGFVGGTRITGNTATGHTKTGGGIYNTSGGQDEIDPTSSVDYNRPDQCNADTTADAVTGC